MMSSPVRGLRVGTGPKNSRGARSVASALALVSTAVVALAAIPATSSTAGTTSVVDPDWSGLDARQWSGEIPPAGQSLAEVPLPTRLSVPGAGTATRLLYSTSNGRAHAEVSTAAVFLPPGEAPAGGWPVLAWAHGTTGIGDGCTPSALPRSDRDSAYLEHWLRSGYAVVATDYAGLGTPGPLDYLDNRASAAGLIDSVAAARSAGHPLSARWALVGHSQGASAALAAASRAETLGTPYGLDLRGTVVSGTPAGLEEVIRWLGPTTPPVTLPGRITPYLLYVLAGMRSAHPELGLDRALSPLGRSLVDAAGTLCTSALTAVSAPVTVNALFADHLSALPGFEATLRDYLEVSATGYRRPVFVAHGLLDIDIPVPSSISVWARMRLVDAPVELHLYPRADHSSVIGQSVPDSTPFLARAFAG